MGERHGPLDQPLQFRPVPQSDGVDLQHPFDEPIIALPRPGDGESQSAFRGSHEREGSPTVIQVPKPPVNTGRPGLEIGIIVLPQGEYAVEIHQAHVQGHELREAVEIDELTDLRREFLVRSLVQQLQEIHHLDMLGFLAGRLDVQSLLVRFPRIPTVPQAFLAPRLHDQPAPSPEPTLHECLVDLLHQGVDPQREILVPPRNADRDLRERRP